MKFLALVAALLLEQLRPLPGSNPVYSAFSRYSAWIERQLNAGQHFQGVLAWLLAVGSVTLFVLFVLHSLAAMSPLLAWAWSVTVLYATLGLTRFSRRLHAVLRALREGEPDRARAELGAWRRRSAAELTEPEIARVSIELALTGSHRHLFGPIVWFLLLGPAGAVVYRASALLTVAWNAQEGAERGEFGRFAAQFFYAFDWIPSRLTALSFAIVGNFEDAVYCWRTQALAWEARRHGVILASGAGALGVRLGAAVHQNGTIEVRPELGLGDDADADYMQSAIGLIWRALVLWLFLAFILTVARSLG
jgi:adenosylcobinamide-phosphate synthase